MDRRQKKTQKAIFDAFIKLISEKNYSKITIQEIIDEADIGRSTFYSHFQTKDELLQAMCKDIFAHIFSVANDANHTHGHQQHSGLPNSALCHILQHIQENDHNILTLLSCEDNEFFLQYFRKNLDNLMFVNFIQCRPKSLITVDTEKSHENNFFGTSPSEDFILNHISGAFIAMIQWWIKGGLKESPEQLDAWFTQVTILGL